MKLIQSATVTAGALVLALSPTVAMAHGGGTPFENCTEAYEAGHSDIPESSDHYGDHLDRDQDGIGCDNPPADFEPADPAEPAGDTTGDDGEESTSEETAGQEGPDLAETGSTGMTPYYAVGGGLVLLAGATVLVGTRKRRHTTD